MLYSINNKRRELGLEPVDRLSEEIIKETEDAMNPRDRATPQRMNSRQPGQIQTNRPEKNLPQLEASEQLRHFFGNRYN